MQWFRAPFPARFRAPNLAAGRARSLDGERYGQDDRGVDRDEHEQLSPAGQIDSWADLASGLRSNRAGRRRALRMLGWLAAVLVVVAAVLLLAH